MLFSQCGDSFLQVEKLFKDEHGNQRYKCPGSKVHAHVSVQQNTQTSVRFHPHLVTLLADAINRSCTKL